MKIYFGERDAPQLAIPQQTMLKQVVSTGLKFYANKLNYELSLTLVSPAEITALNKEYRNIDGPTDVLSFPNTGAVPVKGRRGTRPTLHIGDIVICHNVAEVQAQEYGHSYERELAFLTAHGLLHLIGYDHNTPEDEAEMIAAQKEILAWVGVQR